MYMPPGASQEIIKQIRFGLYVALWSAWAAIPMIVLLLLLLSKPIGLLWLTSWWTPLVFLWAASIVVLFGWLLFSIVSQRQQKSDASGHARANTAEMEAVTECSLSLLCSLSLGLPSILLSAVPFLALNMTSLQEFFPYGNIVDLRRERPPARTVSSEGVTGEMWRPKPNLYIVGIDVSDSFLGPQSADSELPGRSPTGDHDRIELITDSILDLFDDKGIVGERWRPDDTLTIRTFAGETSPNPWITNDGSAQKRKHVIRQLREGRLREHIAETRNVDVPGYTDVLGFLNTAVLDEIEPGAYDQIKVILFSDLQQVQDGAAYVSSEDRKEIDAKITRLAKRIKNYDRMSVIALTTPAKGIVEDGVVHDIGKHFNGHLRPWSWQVHDLARFRSRHRTEKGVELIGLYDDVHNVGTIYLKYITSRDDESVPSYVLLNDNIVNFTIGLRKRDLDMHSEDDNPEYMRVSVGDDRSQRWLELDGVESSAESVTLFKGADNRVPIALHSGHRLHPESRTELLIALPPNTVYRVPVTILAMEDAKVDAVNALGWVLLVLNLVSVMLAWHCVTLERRKLFGTCAASPI